MRTYYCNKCQKTITFDAKETIKKCNDCTTIFENTVNKGHTINMRSTWSGTTKVEFSETTMEKSIARMNR